MNFLNKVGFDEEKINDLENVIPKRIKNLLIDNQKLVLVNLVYLRDLGITNYVDVFMRFFDMFLLDASTFRGIFDKYDQKSLIEKIQKNVNIVEYL